MKLVWMDSLNANEIALNYELFKELSEPKGITLRFGSLKIDVKPCLTKDLPNETIGLQKNLSSDYLIPTDIPYETFIRDGEIHIGPLIAYISVGTFEKLPEKIYFKIIPKFMNYQLIKGLIIICTANSIDIEKEVVEGYYFNPEATNSQEVWYYGKFPLPTAVFNRSFMSQRKIASFQEKMGDTLFNSYWYNLDKWKIWRNLSKDEIVRKHLPYTENFRRINQVKVLLDKYNSVYLKPRKKSRGKGIISLTKEKEVGVRVNYKMKTYQFSDMESCGHFLRTLVKGPYIVQQAVPFCVGGKLVDFRLVLQKNARGDWVYVGLMGRVSLKGSVITNMPGNESTLPGRETLISQCELDERSAEEIEREMTQLVTRAVKSYEALGLHLGDVAADLVLDSNHNLWLLELQLNHAIYGNTNILHVEFFQKVLTNPFQYAKRLAGFKAEPPS